MKLSIILATLFSSSAFAAQSEALTSYIEIQSKLADDNFKDVPSLALKISEIEKGNKSGDLAKKLSSSKTIEDARSAFKALSESIIATTPKKDLGDLMVATCPMANAKWIQRGVKVQNPYYGKSMLECGEILP